MNYQDHKKEKTFEQENTIRFKEKKEGAAIAWVKLEGELWYQASLFQRSSLPLSGLGKFQTFFSHLGKSRTI